MVWWTMAPDCSTSRYSSFGAVKFASGVGPNTGKPNRLANELRRGLVIVSAALISWLTISASPVLAQVAPTTLRVETFVVPPFVIAKDGALTGFSIELWQSIAERLKAKTIYQIAPEVGAAFEALRSNKADLLVSGVFITSERDKDFDFSYTILEAGQQLMVRDTGGGARSNPLADLLRLLSSKTALVWLGVAVLLMLVPANLIWLLEHRRKDGIIPTARYFPGIFHAMHWSATTLLTQAAQTPRQPQARVVSFLLMFTGVVFVALYTAQLTANLTVQQIQGAINGLEDLPGKRVGTLKGSVSVDHLRAFTAQVEEFSQIDELFEALLNRKVDAVHLGSPPLRYFAAHEGKGLVKTVGPEFHRTEVGIVLPLDTPLRRQVNSALVAIREDGTYQRLYDKWFGSK